MSKAFLFFTLSRVNGKLGPDVIGMIISSLKACPRCKKCEEAAYIFQRESWKPLCPSCFHSLQKEYEEWHTWATPMDLSDVWVPHPLYKRFEEESLWHPWDRAVEVNRRGA